MAYIHIDREKAHRLIALIFREESKMSSDDANALASSICMRLTAAMPAPTKPGLHGYRMIRRFPPDATDFANEVTSKLADIDERLARVLWETVYEQGAELPDDVADSVRY
jgi:hypothetical protein